MMQREHTLPGKNQRFADRPVKLWGAEQAPNSRLDRRPVLLSRGLVALIQPPAPAKPIRFLKTKVVVESGLHRFEGDRDGFGWIAGVIVDFNQQVSIGILFMVQPDQRIAVVISEVGLVGIEGCAGGARDDLIQNKVSRPVRMRDRHPVISMVVAGEKIFNAIALQQIDELVPLVRESRHVFRVGVAGASEGHLVREDENMFHLVRGGLLEHVFQGVQIDAVNLAGDELIERDHENFRMAGRGKEITEARFAGQVGDIFCIQARLDNVSPTDPVGVTVGFMIAADGINGQMRREGGDQIGPGAQLIGDFGGHLRIFSANQVAREKQKVRPGTFDIAQQLFDHGPIDSRWIWRSDFRMNIGSIVARHGKRPRTGG